MASPLLLPVLLGLGAISLVYARRRQQGPGLLRVRVGGRTVTAELGRDGFIRPGKDQGWSLDENGANVTPELASWLDRYRAHVPSSIPIVVTSAVRTPTEQASAMLSKVKRGEDLYALYGQDDLLDELFQAPQNTADWAQVLQGQVDRGRYISRHMRRDALDLRTRNLNQSQVRTLIEVARAGGVDALLESDHLHLENIV